MKSEKRSAKRKKGKQRQEDPIRYGPTNGRRGRGKDGKHMYSSPSKLDKGLEMVGFEGCCDGWQTLNVALPSACTGNPGENCGVLDQAAADWLLVDSTAFAGSTTDVC